MKRRLLFFFLFILILGVSGTVYGVYDRFGDTLPEIIFSEPASLLLIGMGLIGFAGMGIRK